MPSFAHLSLHSLATLTHPLPQGPGPWEGVLQDSPSSSSRESCLAEALVESGQRRWTPTTRMAWRGRAGGAHCSAPASMEGEVGAGAGRTTPTTGNTPSKGPGGRVQEVGAVGGMGRAEAVASLGLRQVHPPPPSLQTPAPAC